MGIFGWVEKIEKESEQVANKYYKKHGQYSVEESNFGQLHGVATAKTKAEALAKLKKIGKSNPTKTYYALDNKNLEGSGFYYRFSKGKLNKVA
jgi:hypothetical protein